MVSTSTTSKFNDTYICLDVTIIITYTDWVVNYVLKFYGPLKVASSDRTKRRC